MEYGMQPDKSRSFVPETQDFRFYLVGGGIASLAAAVFLIRDGHLSGNNITIFEETGTLGGSLDGAGSPEDGYVARGGRMLESHYVCTFDLFSAIPALDGSKTVTNEILSWNELYKTCSHSRLVRGGQKLDTPAFGLSERHRLALVGLSLQPESMLGESSIQDHFDETFFETNFWFMWATTFAFQPWHSAVEFRRYLLRFVHMVPGFNRLEGIMRTVFNQYDSMVRPLCKWLEEHGVNFETNAKVIDILFEEKKDAKHPTNLILDRAGKRETVELSSKDFVIVTLGSMTDSSSLGAMDRAPVWNAAAKGASWMLWEKIAAGHPEFGKPSVFDSRAGESKWISFTGTMRDPGFFRFVRNFSSNVPGEGGLITFCDSSWLMSIVLPHQPHFAGQPSGVNVFWGYGLFTDKPGDFVRKPMEACSGREILTELSGHLGLKEDAQRILDTSTCIPCMMPYITSQFLTRAEGDRPHILPQGWSNLAFVGQFCEIPDDVVFTVEYSVRAAQTAVYSLLELDRTPPAVYKGQYNPAVLFKAFNALHDKPAF